MAKQLSSDLGAELLPIKVLSKREPLSEGAPLQVDAGKVSDKNVIGFVFPVHGGNPPKNVQEAIGSIEYNTTSYIFAVCTYGISAGHSLPKVDKILKEHGGRLSAGFAVAMPQSGIGSKRIPKEEMETTWAEARQKTADISDFLQARKSGHIESQNPAVGFLKAKSLRLLPSVFTLIWKLITVGAKGLTQVSDERCIGCGTCASLCPVDNIQMKDGHPVWLDHCVGCFGCYHWCPQSAVSFGGNDMDLVQFHHPDVTVADMIGKTL